MKYFICLLLLSSGCSLFREKVVYDKPIVDEVELKRQLTSACESAKTKGRPVLLEFSADWCGDCQKLSHMKLEPALATELKGWDFVVINVGQFDQHTQMLEAFEVNSIANWSVVSPVDCASPAMGWPLQAQRTLEPKSGQPVTSIELTQWLQEQLKAAAPAKSPEKGESMKGLTQAQERAVVDAKAIDDRLRDVEPEELSLENFSAEGAVARIWRYEDGNWAKLVVESKGETYDTVGTIYAQEEHPFFARRFHFFDPAKFDEDGSETYAEAVAARTSESTLFFIVDHIVVGVSTTGALPSASSAKYDDGSLVEPPISAVHPIDPTDETFEPMTAFVAEIMATVFEKPKE